MARPKKGPARHRRRFTGPIGNAMTQLLSFDSRRKRYVGERVRFRRPIPYIRRWSVDRRLLVHNVEVRENV